MCGVVGILHRGRLGDAPNRTKAMADSIIHRGPDGEGFWADRDVAFGFRRLAIVDLETGAQPMCNEDGSVWVVFNGEIYNHRELRRDLEARGHIFKSDHSDTETLVHGFEEWGEKLPERLNGMFAFAVWDQRQRKFLAARDRLGIKPLFLAEQPDGALVFASEIRALHASGLVAKEPDAGAVSIYFQQQNLWGTRSMFKGVRQLKAGHVLVDDGKDRKERQFWTLDLGRRETNLKRGADALRAALEGAIRRQVAADVPVMAYLSGGVDSSSIVAAAYRMDPKVRAYSCIFDLEEVGEDGVCDEREFSRLVASDLGIQHIELQVERDALARELKPTIAALEEPRMGMAYVNAMIARRVAADSKVVLSGCGGDEILGGYVGRYGFVGQRNKERFNDARWIRRAFDWLSGRTAGDASHREKILTLLGFPVSPGQTDIAFTPEFAAEAGPFSLSAELDGFLAQFQPETAWDEMMIVDTFTYLGGLLMVEDKLSMAHSLETRVPLLDNELIDLASSFAWPLLTDGQTGKIVFREAIRDWVPKQIAEKPKMGFGPPDASWYRGPLQSFIRGALSPDRIKARGIFDPAFVSTAVNTHMDGSANRLPIIWSLLSLEAWCEINGFYGGDLGRPLETLRSGSNH